jgi:hypothetical protein
LKTWRFKDWRLAKRVTEDTYNKITHNASADAVIYGIPVGASYGDFQENIKHSASSHDESLTEAEATNILWTGLGMASSEAYKHCLDRVTDSLGIHLTVNHATDNDVSINIRWAPLGGEPKVQLKWSGELATHSTLPKSAVTGSQTVVIGRPAKEQQLAVNVVGHGASDSIVLTPLVLVPRRIEKPGATEFHQTTNDKLQFLRRGGSIEWGTPLLQEGAYNASVTLRLHPDPSGAQFRVNYHVSVNGKIISTPGIWVDVQFGDHPDVITVGAVVDLPHGPTTISLHIEGVYNLDSTYGNFTNPDAGAVAVSNAMSISLRRINEA